jgi:hypothetical protein
MRRCAIARRSTAPPTSGEAVHPPVRPGHPTVPRSYRSAAKRESWGTLEPRRRVPQDSHLGPVAAAPAVGAGCGPMAVRVERMRVVREEMCARCRRIGDVGPASFPLGCARTDPIRGPRPVSAPGGSAPDGCGGHPATPRDEGRCACHAGAARLSVIDRGHRLARLEVGQAGDTGVRRPPRWPRSGTIAEPGARRRRWEAP